MLVVGLVEEDVLAVAALGGPLLEDALLVDAVLGAEALPEHGAHWARETGETGGTGEREGRALWFPHWPIWTVTISRGILFRRVQRSQYSVSVSTLKLKQPPPLRTRPRRVRHIRHTLCHTSVTQREQCNDGRWIAAVPTTVSLQHDLRKTGKVKPTGTDVCVCV